MFKVGRILLLAVGLGAGLAMVSLVLLSQIETKLESKNIVFVPSKKNGEKDPILLASIDGNSQKISVYQFPGSLKATVLGGYGEYPLGSVQPLLKLEQKEPRFIQAAFGSIFERAVNQIYEYQSMPQAFTKTSLVRLLLENRSTWSLAWQVYQLDGLHFSYRQVADWPEWGRTLSNQALGRISDHCSVAVVNASGKNGLAGQLAKILEKSGVEVVRTTDNIWGEPKTAIYQDQDYIAQCQPIVQIIQAMSPIALTETIDQTKPTQYRARLVLFIGEELAEILK